MTASSIPGPAGPAGSGPFDSTAQLMDRITAQLTSQLSRVTPRGRPRPSPAAPRAREAPPALVAVAHGSRDPAALRTVTALLARVRALRPGLPVHLGHIELNAPLLGDTLAGLTGEAVLVPLLLAPGYHVKHDIPAAAAAAPHLRLRIAAPLGPHPLLADALYERLAEAGWDGAARAGAGVVLAAAGSRDPDSAAGTARTAALLSTRLGGVPVLPGYASATGPGAPSVAEAVRALADQGRRRIAVARCFTAPGLFAGRCAAAAPGPVSAPLGDHPALARLILHRYEQALGSAPVPHASSTPVSYPAVTVGV
ncbi:sirohydrochlorin chelatase [Streptomyces sp. XD-27]|uniref:sirohydrochlorin chelatase n=1 Tax=Streptomyces sp. XD-27 TaxID=3062779 RepID=UPI0026F47472|nr:sirohydrochlorin chelatase [Streptomyces sp. XD-27]WKX70188.1 sirohydrochlorin chelatase [Streptomyces sp. XD-27]